MTPEQILSDLRPTSVLCAGSGAQEIAVVLHQRGVPAHLLAQGDAPPAKRFDLGVYAGVIGRGAQEEAERAIDALCAHSDCVIFAAVDAEDDAEPGGARRQRGWVTQFARRSFYRDVDCDASWASAGAVCLRRMEGSNLPIIASYERRLAQMERELAAQRLLNQEDRDALQQRDQEVEVLRRESDLIALGRELTVLSLWVAPLGTTRERYLRTAMASACDLISSARRVGARRRHGA